MKKESGNQEKKKPQVLEKKDRKKKGGERDLCPLRKKKEFKAGGKNIRYWKRGESRERRRSESCGNDLLGRKRENQKRKKIFKKGESPKPSEKAKPLKANAPLERTHKRVTAKNNL